MKVPDALPDLAASFTTAMPAFIASSRELEASISRMEAAGDAFYTDAAQALGAYTDRVCPLLLEVWRPLDANFPSTYRWGRDAANIRSNPQERELWNHLVLAMDALAELGHVLTNTLGVDQQAYEVHRRAHRQNVQVLIESSEALPGSEALASAIVWLARRGIDVAKRYNLLIAMTGALQRPPDTTKVSPPK